ncbi:hypothetical protein ACHWQZ_G012322 [Mnemiopsis leidyi]
MNIIVVDEDEVPDKSNRQKILVALLIFGLPFIGGLYVNVYFNSAESDEKWYNTLVKTEFQPPFYIFGPVWTVLLVLNGGAAYLIWMRSGFGEAPLAFVLYYIQIILAIWYVPLFFSLHKLLGSFLVLAALWSMLCIKLIMFARIYYFAGILVVPYLIWVTFNTILNFSIYRLN